jgi:hypothetical protein
MSTVMSFRLSRSEVHVRKHQPTAVVAQRVHKDRRQYSRKHRNERSLASGW